MRCFAENMDGAIVCQACGRPFEVTAADLAAIGHDLLRIHRQCTQGSPSRSALAGCIHRGQEIRREACATCRGVTHIKIHACALHGECEMAGKIANVKFCGRCTDFAAAD